MQPSEYEEDRQTLAIPMVIRAVDVHDVPDIQRRAEGSINTRVTILLRGIERLGWLY